MASLTKEGVEVVPGEDRRFQTKLIHLYILGDVLDDVHLRNRVMEILVCETPGFPSPRTLERVWEKTPENSLLRKMLVSRATLRACREGLARHMSELPEGFVRQLAMSLLQRVPFESRRVFEAELPSYLEPVEDK
jgi:hypothetical protein